MLRSTPGDPRGAEKHHWNTGAKENQQLNPGGPSNRQKSSGQSVETAVKKGIVMMIAIVKIQLNASVAMTITQFFSRDCPTWNKEKAVLKVKHEKSITFPEALKIVEKQFAAPGKSYASITKGAGVHVSCTDAQTQTDEACITELRSSTSNAESKPTLHVNLLCLEWQKFKWAQFQILQLSQNLLKRSLHKNLLKRSLHRKQTIKSIYVEQRRDRMIPLKLTIGKVPLTRTTWIRRFLLPVLVKVSFLEYLQVDTKSSNLTTSLRQYNYYQ